MKTSVVKNKPAGLYVVGTTYPYITGGMEIFNYYFLNYQLKQNGNTIYYLGSHPANEANGHFVPLKPKWPARLFYPIQFFLAIRKLRKKVDYAHLSFAEQSWILSYSQSLVLRLFRIPYIITIHWGKEPEWKFKYPFLRFFRKAHSVIGVSEPICKAYEKVLETKKVLFVPPLIPFETSAKAKTEAKKQLGYNDDDKVILFIGSLKGMKNPDKIVEAIKKTEPAFLSDNKIRLLLAGSGEMEAALKAAVENAGLGEHVKFAGLVKRENVSDYYKAADCYIISSDYEGTSVSLLEAMYNKLPIIASDAPGINMMLKNNHNALLYPTTDTDKLAQCIRQVFTDKSLAERLSENAYRDFSNKYSYESMMEKYRDVFSAAANDMPMNLLNITEPSN